MTVLYCGKVSASPILPLFLNQHSPMDLTRTSTFRPLPLPEYAHFRRGLHGPFFLRRLLSPKPTLSRQPAAIVMAQKKPKIEGVGEELNSIASQNLDHAPARRRVRSAFANVQQQLDHVLLKVFHSRISHFSCSLVSIAIINS